MADAKPGETHLHQLFSIPLVVVHDAVDPDLGDVVTAWAVAERDRSPGLHVANVGGWHSQPDLPARGEPALDALFGEMVEHVRRVHGTLAHQTTGTPPPPGGWRLGMQAWAMVMERGAYTALHDHAGSHWSAVYYADAGDEANPESGRIWFVNPAGAHRNVPGVKTAPTTFHLKPVTGQLIVFPGWLQHGVEAYQGQRPRVAIAANFEVARPQ